MPRKVLIERAPEPHQDGAIQVEVTLAVRQRRGETRGHRGSASHTGSRPRIPRITRLMALAIKFQDMVDCGEVRDYADLARLGYVTRARITQIMNLLLLAPDIQEEIVGLGGAVKETIPTERHVRSVVKFVLWDRQRRAWIQAERPTCA
jgi:hypothetical protein